MIFARMLCTLIFVVSVCNAAELTTFDGKKSSGDLLSANSKEVAFKSNGMIETLEPNKVALIELNPIAEPAQGATWIEVQLVDGSQFHCSEFSIKGKQVALTLLSSNAKAEPVKVTLPLASLFYMIRDFQDPKIAKQFAGILARRNKRDVYLFGNDTLDRFDGTFGDADEKGETIEFEGENNSKNSVAIKRIKGMILNPPPREIALTLCKVTDVNRNEIYTKEITVSVEQKMTVTSTAGVTVEYPAPAGIAKIDFSVGSLSYLSNLEPKKTTATDNRFSRDGLLDKTELKIGDQKYLKGLAIWAGSVLTYDIAGKYKTFETVAGIDANASESILNDVSVILTIEADNKVVFKEKIQKTDVARNVNVNVVGVKTLRITVESEGLLDFGNQVDLADAKLRK